MMNIKGYLAMSYGITINGFHWLRNGGTAMTFDKKKDAERFVRHNVDDRCKYRYRVVKI